MKPATRSTSAFTLVELLITLGVIAILGGVTFALLNAGITLYAQNVSINRTLSDGLVSTEKLLANVAEAEGVPVLLDANGATVAGNGPAAGIGYFASTSAQAYPIPYAVTASAMSITVRKSLAQPAPMRGDKVTIPDLGFQADATNVTFTGTEYVIAFAGTVGSGFATPKTTGTVIPANWRCFLRTPKTFISVNSELRHYWRAMSVTANGAAAFNNPTNFAVVGTLLPTGTATNCLPFQFIDPAKRSIDVNLRLRAPAHGGVIGQFYTFENLATTVAFRSAATQ